MKPIKLLPILAMMLALVCHPAMAETTISYQGHLKQGGSAHDGTVSMNFSLWDGPSGSSQVGSTITQNVAVADGLFQVELDFGHVFATGQRWLQVEVGGTVLDPRQRVTAAPVAVYALSAPGDGNGSHWTLSGGELSYAGPVSIGADPEEVNLEVAGGIEVENSSIFTRTAIRGTVAGSGHGVGVAGLGSGTGAGVIGTHASPSGQGVRGISTSGTGVFGQAGNIGANQGVYGFSQSGDGYGVRGRNTATGGTGLLGESTASTGTGIRGEAGPSGTGVLGEAGIVGVYGRGAIGIVGEAGAGGHGAFFFGPEDSKNWFQRPVGIGDVGTPDAMLHIVDNQNQDQALSWHIRVDDDDGVAFAVFANGMILGKPAVGSSLYLSHYRPGGQTSVCKHTDTGNPAVGTLAQCSSSARYKQDIESIDSAAALVEKLRAVSYQWISSGEADLGLVAEEVADIEPRLVTFNADGQVEGVKYDRLAAVLVAAMQEQKQQSETEIAALRLQLDRQREELEMRLDRLESLLDESRLAASER
jgi:hypothetical protein